MYKSSENGSLELATKLPTLLNPGKHLVLLDVWHEGRQIERLYDFMVVNKDLPGESVQQGRVKIGSTAEPKINNTEDFRLKNDTLTSNDNNIFNSIQSRPDSKTLDIHRDNSRNLNTNVISVFIVSASCILIVSIIWGLRTYGKKRKN